MGRRSVNNVAEIKYPSRVEGWIEVCEIEGESRLLNMPWSPLYCVLQQEDQTFTAYCSEELSIFPVTPNREIKLTDVFFADFPRVRLDHRVAPRSMKTIWETQTPTVHEEPEDTENGSLPEHIDLNTTLKSSLGKPNRSDSLVEWLTPIKDTSYEKACRRGSAPTTPIMGQKDQQSSSRFTNFFSKRSFRSNPLKRTKSVTKLERSKRGPGGLRGSRSHESLLSTHAVMSTIDLSCAGAVGVAPVHASVLGRQHCFQVRGGPRGERYYSCGSRQERDLWIYSLRKSISPNAEHTRRTDNSLKMWIYEAKALPPKKRYFCEINLDKTLYGRTSVKLKTELLFWGEYFDFPDVPDINVITVNVYREGDKKKKRDKHVLVGSVKIPIHEVTSRTFSEDWYPIISEKHDSISKNSSKEPVPTLRIKCRFQSIDILPLEMYAPFLDYLKENYKRVCETLEPVIGVKAKEDIGQALVLLMHAQGMAGAFLTDVVALDLLRVGDQRLTFRGNSMATKSMEAFLKLTGEQYLQDTLTTVISEIIASDRDCEVDPLKANGSLSRQQQSLRSAIRVFWNAIYDSHKQFPPQLRECFATFRERLQVLDREDMADNLISASIFLRFLCPAILSPSLFNITNELPSTRATRNLTLVAKTLQTLANFTRFQGKEDFMEFLNDFLEQEAPKMKIFLHNISNRPENPQADSILDWSGYIDQGKQLSILHTLLSESMQKLSAARQLDVLPLGNILDDITKIRESNSYGTRNSHSSSSRMSGSQENHHPGNIMIHQPQAMDKPTERGVMRGVLTPSSLEKNIFRYNDPTVQPLYNHQHSNTNSLQHSHSTNSLSSNSHQHQPGTPIMNGHQFVNGGGDHHHHTTSRTNVNGNSHYYNTTSSLTNGKMASPNLNGGGGGGGGFRSSTMPRNNHNGIVSHEQQQDGKHELIQIGLDPSNPFGRKSPTPHHKPTPPAANPRQRQLTGSQLSLLSERGNRQPLNLGIPHNDHHLINQPALAPASNPSNMPLNLEDLDDLLKYAEEQNIENNKATKEPPNGVSGKGSNVSIGQISNVCSSGYQSITTQSQSSSPVDLQQQNLDFLNKNLRKQPAAVTSKYGYINPKYSVNTTNNNVTVTAQPALAFKNPLYHMQNSGNNNNNNNNNNVVHKNASLTPSSSDEHLNNVEQYDLPDEYSTHPNGALLSGDGSRSFMGGDRRQVGSNSSRVPRSNQLMLYKREDPIEIMPTYQKESHLQRYQRRLSVESARTLSDSSTDTEGIHLTAEHKRRRNTSRSVEQCEREIQRLQASVDSLRHKLEESDIKDSNDDLAAISKQSDNKIRCIITRLLAMEDELKREQYKMSMILSHKQRVIEAQGQQIAALDAANNRLLSALSTLKNRYETGTNCKAPPSAQKGASLC